MSNTTSYRRRSWNYETLDVTEPNWKRRQRTLHRKKKHNTKELTSLTVTQAKEK